jgi:hypothetical protein
VRAGDAGGVNRRESVQVKLLLLSFVFATTHGQSKEEEIARVSERIGF